MSKLFKFILSTPDAVLFDGQVEYVAITTPNGEVGIMADHLPMVSLISPGVLKIKDTKEEKVLATGTGFIKVLGSACMAYTQTAEFADSIDEQRALEAQKQAESIMNSKADEISLADATSLLERSIARLKAVEHKKKRSHH